MPPEKKKRFDEKFKVDNGEWKPTLGGNWQTKKGVEVPKDPETGEMPEWVANIRLWAFEMNQWATAVREELVELRDELETLKKNTPPRPGTPAVPAPRS